MVDYSGVEDNVRVPVVHLPRVLTSLLNLLHPPRSASTQAFPWAIAEAQCEANGMRLVQIVDPADFAVLKNLTAMASLVTREAQWFW